MTHVVTGAGGGLAIPRAALRAVPKEAEMAVYILTVLLVLLIIYLFYAVIHPERF